MNKPKEGYVMGTRAMDTYGRTRLFPKGFHTNDIRQINSILTLTGYLPSEAEKILSGAADTSILPPDIASLVGHSEPEKLEVVMVHENQDSPRESIYLLGDKLIIAMPGGRSRWRRYNDLCLRFTEECVPALKKYKGHKIDYVDVSFKGSAALANERFDQLDSWLVGILMGDESPVLMPDLTRAQNSEIRQMMERTVAVVFGSQAKILSRLNETGQNNGIKAFSNEYLNFQFIPLPDGKYMLGVDYTYGRQTGSIIGKLADIIDMEARAGHWPVDENGNVPLWLIMYGKLGALNPNLNLGDIVAPNAIYMRNTRMPIKNPLREYVHGCKTGTVLPTDTVAKQRLEKLWAAIELGAADIIEMELRDAYLAVDRIALENHVVDTEDISYLGRISDRPYQGITLADEIENKHADDKIIDASIAFASDKARLIKK